MTTLANSKNNAVEVLATKAREAIVVAQEYQVVSIDRAIRWAKEPDQVLTVAQARNGATALWVRFVDFAVKVRPIEKIKQFVTKAEAVTISAKILLERLNVEIGREKVGAVNR